MQTKGGQSNGISQSFSDDLVSESAIDSTDFVDSSVGSIIRCQSHRAPRLEDGYVGWRCYKVWSQGQVVFMCIYVFDTQKNPKSCLEMRVADWKKTIATFFSCVMSAIGGNGAGPALHHQLGDTDEPNDGNASVKKRTNVLLLGDRLGDLGMSDGLNYENQIAVGFLILMFESLLYQLLADCLKRIQHMFCLHFVVISYNC